MGWMGNLFNIYPTLHLRMGRSLLDFVSGPQAFSLHWKGAGWSVCSIMELDIRSKGVFWIKVTSELRCRASIIRMKFVRLHILIILLSFRNLDEKGLGSRT